MPTDNAAGYRIDRQEFAFFSISGFHQDWRPPHGREAPPQWLCLTVRTAHPVHDLKVILDADDDNVVERKERTLPVIGTVVCVECVLPTSAAILGVDGEQAPGLQDIDRTVSGRNGAGLAGSLPLDNKRWHLARPRPIRNLRRGCLRMKGSPDYSRPHRHSGQREAAG